MKLKRTVVVVLVALSSWAVHAQPNLWLSRGPGGGGALYTPSLSPYQCAEAFVTCDMGGMYRTTDWGCSWALLSSSTIVGSTQGCQVQFTSDPHILYAIDYTAELPAPAKSIDGGATWTRLAADPTGGGAFTILADPSRTDRLLVTDYSNLYFSGDGGTSFSLKATDAAGLYIAGGIFDGSSIYVGTATGLLVSANSGSTFSPASIGGIPAAQAIVSMAAAREGAILRFVCVTLGSADVWPGVTGADHLNYQGVYTLDWGQTSWVPRTTGIAAGDHPFFAGMSRGNASVMTLAGGSNAGVPVVYRSANGGLGWSSVLLTTDNQNIVTGWCGSGGDRSWGYPEYALGLAVSPVDPNKVIFTDLGFAHGTTDGGSTWRQLYVHPSGENAANAPTPTRHYYRGVGLENTSCWWLTWSSANNIFAPFTDIRGVRSTDGGTTWGFDYTGHTLNTMYYCVRHGNGALYAATASVHDLYESTYLQDSRIDGGSGQVLFSTDAGATWQPLHDFGAPVVWVALDPTNANRLYASVVRHLPTGTGGVWVSSNIQNGAASTWTKLADPTRTEGHPFNLVVLGDGTLVATYLGRRDSAGTFTASSGVFVLPAGQSVWLDRSDTGMRYWAKDLVLDPRDAAQNTWYAAVFSGWGGPPNGLGGLYRTTNRGLGWTRINALDRVESCTLHPTSATEAYLTTEIEGLWHTADLGSVTPTFTRVASYPFLHPLRAFFNPYASSELWVTSFGYGMTVGLIGSTRATEVSSDVIHALKASKSGSNVDIMFQDTGAAHYNLYVSALAGTHPAKVLAASNGKKQCALASLVSVGGGLLKVSGYDLEMGITGSPRLLCFVISGDGGSGTEGPLGYDSLGEEITADAFCAR